MAWRAGSPSARIGTHRATPREHRARTSRAPEPAPRGSGALRGDGAQGEELVMTWGPNACA
jgi:hypothetical protein